LRFHDSGPKGANRYTRVVESSSTNLLGLDTARIAAEVLPSSTESWRARQIASWIYRQGADSIKAMTDLPKSLRLQLAEQFRIDLGKVLRRQSTDDGVEKLLVHAGDGQGYECVLLPFSRRVSCCLSSQVGCPMGCRFCATGLGGFDRNLTPAEILGQYLLLQQLSSRRIGHVVFMGMGEPLLNLENVLVALRLLHAEVGLSYRHMTVSTVGIVPKIAQLAEAKLPIHLAISLHSPFDDVRSRLMPVNKRWTVAEVFSAAREYHARTRRKITFEYLLIADVTDTRAQAKELARLIAGIPSVVNLIPFNFVDTAEGFERPTAGRVHAFRRELESRGVNVTERAERGHRIAAACGQLAGSHRGNLSRRVPQYELPQYA
jgi:23S rRNA (adenine2503-C2)-methyltransferase